MSRALQLWRVASDFRRLAIESQRCDPPKQAAELTLVYRARLRRLVALVVVVGGRAARGAA